MSRSELAWIVAHLDESCRLTAPCLRPRISKAALLRQIGGSRIHSATQVRHWVPVSDHPMSLCFTDPDSPRVKADKETQVVAESWARMTEGLPLWRPMVHFKVPSTLAMRVAAWASGGRLGVGGWWSFFPKPMRAQCTWFPLQLQLGDFPASWDLPSDAQRCIAGFETLAQTFLLCSAREAMANCNGPCLLLWTRTTSPPSGPPTGCSLTAGPWPTSSWCLHNGPLRSTTKCSCITSVARTTIGPMNSATRRHLSSSAGGGYPLGVLTSVWRMSSARGLVDCSLTSMSACLIGSGSSAISWPHPLEGAACLNA